MTTKAQQETYEAQHLSVYGDRKWVIYNPHGKPQSELPVIIGFNNGGSPGWMAAVAIAEDGVVLGSHTCSSEVYMEHDLGILEGTRPDRHEHYRKHYPDGYRMEFVGYDSLKGHAKLNTALELNAAMAEK